MASESSRNLDRMAGTLGICLVWSRMDLVLSSRMEGLRAYDPLIALDQNLLDTLSRVGQHANHKIENKLDKIIEILKKGIHRMSVEFDNMTAQVQANSEAIDSAIVLINGIADRIAAAGVDPVKLQALTTELRAKDEALATAVTANTPAAPVA
jgi:hypothetical protein